MNAEPTNAEPQQKREPLADHWRPWLGPFVVATVGAFLGCFAAIYLWATIIESNVRHSLGQ